MRNESFSSFATKDTNNQMSPRSIQSLSNIYTDSASLSMSNNQSSITSREQSSRISHHSVHQPNDKDYRILMHRADAAILYANKISNRRKNQSKKIYKNFRNSLKTVQEQVYQIITEGEESSLNHDIQSIKNDQPIQKQESHQIMRQNFKQNAQQKSLRKRHAINNWSSFKKLQKQQQQNENLFKKFDLRGQSESKTKYHSKQQKDNQKQVYDIRKQLQILQQKYKEQRKQVKFLEKELLKAENEYNTLRNYLNSKRAKKTTIGTLTLHPTQNTGRSDK